MIKHQPSFGFTDTVSLFGNNNRGIISGSVFFARFDDRAIVRQNAWKNNFLNKACKLFLTFFFLGFTTLLSSLYNLLVYEQASDK